MSEITECEASRIPLLEGATDAQARLLAVSAMTCTLLHELMQPLCAATNYLGTASRQIKANDLSPDLGEAVSRAEAAISRAVNIIHGMRTFVLTGAVDTRPAALRDLIDRARSQLPEADRQTTEITTKFASDAQDVAAHGLLVELVFANLLQNASEAASPAHAEISISSCRQGGNILVTVSDDGPGLSEEVIADLFTPLFTTKPTGSGLGLPLCKVIVEAHGGRLWVGDPSPDGATFYMTLPAAPDQT